MPKSQRFVFFLHLSLCHLAQPLSCPSPVLLSLSELVQRCVQVSLAQLWQGADVLRWNEKTHPCAASGVSWNTFDLTRTIRCVGG